MIPGLCRMIIGAPFGNYFRPAGYTRTLGTYTVARRTGLFGRIWKIATTLRYSRADGGWINRLGLPNHGIGALGNAAGCIVSVRGFSREEWVHLLGCVRASGAAAVELNLSCPNVDTQPSLLEYAAYAASLFELPVIAKMPPIGWEELMLPLWRNGVRFFHFCNALPTPRGGLSGKALQSYSLDAVLKARIRYGSSISIIGGGGVYTQQDVARYLDSGADHVAVASMLINPLNWKRLPGLLEVNREDKE